MITVSSKVTKTANVGRVVADHVKRTLSVTLRQQILIEEAQPVVARMSAAAPRGHNNPHAADFLGAVVVDGATSDDARVAIGALDVPGKEDRAFVLGFSEYGTRKMHARPFLRPTVDAEVPGMLARVGDRIAAELKR